MNLLLLIALTVWAQTVDAPPASTVRAILAERTMAVQSRDLAGVARLYAQDDTLVVFRPDGIYRGWPAYRQYWERALSGVPDGFSIRWHEDIVARAADGQIVASLTWDTSGGGSRPQEGRLTLVLERRSNRYLIVHEHLSSMPVATSPR